MRLHHSPTSPFVRKCLVCAHELGLFAWLTLVPAVAHPVQGDARLAELNPLGKIPILETEADGVLYDSRVICEYLDTLAGGGRLLPAPGPARWPVRVDEALGDGILDAAVLNRYETAVRPEKLRWAEWSAGQMAKVGAALATLERRAPALAGRLDVGTIAIGCALGYLDFRYAPLGWRSAHPRLAAWFATLEARPSMLATRPPAGA